VILPRGKFYYGGSLGYNAAKDLVVICTIQKQNYFLQLLSPDIFIDQISINFLGDRIILIKNS